MSNTLLSRVTWAMTATVALFVGLMAVFAFSIMYEQEDELADQLVQIEMHRLIERIYWVFCFLLSLRRGLTM